MNAVVPVACMVLLAAFVAVVVHPVVSERQVWRRQTGLSRLRLVLSERKEQLYASIKELEFDRSLGKMSAEDYRPVRDQLEAEALQVLAQLQALEEGHGVDPDLQTRIEHDARALIRPAAAVAAASRAVSAEDAAPQAFAFCHACGKPRQRQHRFCPYCGQQLEADAPPA